VAGERTLASLANYRKRYAKADKRGRTRVLDEFCKTMQYHRKYAISLLGQPWDTPPPGAVQRRRGTSYGPAVVRALERIWQSAGYPWSLRLKALLPQWVPWARRHMDDFTQEVEQALLKISARQMDRVLADKKRQYKKRLYGQTKPGTLLRNEIRIRTDNWDVHTPGYLEIDLVSHCGPSASGEFVYSLNVTDIHTGWTETRAILGKGERGVVAALEQIQAELPFKLLAIDSDNGSEFINHHLVRWCKKHNIAFTRSRPYKKNDNAHIEQKNWTHVRKILGWTRYDRAEQCAAMNELYSGKLRQMQNLYQPSVKLVEKIRIGSRIRKRYDAPATPLDRLVAWYGEAPLALNVQRLLKEREKTDPFKLSTDLESSVQRLERSGQNGKRDTEEELVI